jgi:hypothetical protein
MADQRIDPAYTQLAQDLAADGVRCQFQTPGQLVISTQVGPVWPDRGNSFWVTNVSGQWYLFTWAPRGYSLPESDRIAALCRAFMASSAKVEALVPENLIAEFTLRELSDEEVETVYRAMPAE